MVTTDQKWFPVVTAIVNVHRKYIIQSAESMEYSTILRVTPGARLKMAGKKKYVKLSTPMGVDYVVIGFDMEVQPFVSHNAA